MQPPSAQTTWPGCSRDVTRPRLVPTPAGDARVVADLSVCPRATLVLGHGAGGGVEARDLAAIAAALPMRGVSVLRVEQPWRVRGGRVAAAAPQLDLAWVAAIRALHHLEPSWLAGPLVVGGRSAGARVACRTADQVGAAGVVALAFPLHPPGRPGTTRAAELEMVTVPVLLVQGDRDCFGAPSTFPPGPEVHVVHGADHGMAVPRRGPLTQSEALQLMVEAMHTWLRRLVAGQLDAPDSSPRSSQGNGASSSGRSGS